MRTTTRVFSRSSHTWMKLLPTICSGIAMNTTPTMIAMEVITWADEAWAVRGVHGVCVGCAVCARCVHGVRTGCAQGARGVRMVHTHASHFARVRAGRDVAVAHRGEGDEHEPRGVADVGKGRVVAELKLLERVDKGAEEDRACHGAGRRARG